MGGAGCKYFTHCRVRVDTTPYMAIERVATARFAKLEGREGSQLDARQRRGDSETIDRKRMQPLRFDTF